MNVSIVGSGYVGTTIAGCLADSGHDIVNIDINEEIVQMLNDGDAPIHEPGLNELVNMQGGDQLRATTNYDAINETDVTFLALPTPTTEEGNIDLSTMKAGARSVGAALANKDDYHLVIVKSTVTPGTAEDVLTPILEDSSGGVEGEDFGIASNPEFLREGTAVSDFIDPDKIVFGTDGDERALGRLREIYQPITDQTDTSVVETDRRVAEMIKYANNAFLASKISLINELGNICKEYDVDTYEVAEAIGLDARIGEQFLRSGVGWGGSCFPKDTKALIAAAENAGYDPSLLKATVEVNDKQPTRMINLAEHYGDLTGKRVAVLGLAFKPCTDDTRNSRAIPLIGTLIDSDADVVGYDPVANENMQNRFPNIIYADSAAAALRDAHAAFIVTDWDEFAVLDEEFDAMATPVVVDGRRIIERREGITYEGLTW